MKLSLNRNIGFILAGIALIAGLVWVVIRSGPLSPIRATVTTASRADVAPGLFGIGVVEARRSYLVGPTAAGRVRQVNVDVGDTVRTGQLLAEMEPVDLDQRLASSVAAVERAKSAVDTAQAQLTDSQSRHKLAIANARRYDDLGRKGFVSSTVTEGKAQEKKSAEAQVAAASATVSGARQDLRRLNSEREVVGAQRASIRLLAPGDGIVTSRDAEPGSTVVAGQGVVKLISPDSLWVKTRLDQNRSAGLQVGLPAEIALRSKPGKPIPGRVVRVELVSDSVTEERIAQVAFDERPLGISVGELAEVTLRGAVVKDALTVPNAALRTRRGKTGIWLYNADSLTFVEVRSGAVGADGRVQILEGLREGDAVIVHSERDVDERSRVKVVPALVASGS
ncbi:MAG: efflux RND transporter periplasmic adaptor subunit [Rhodocyclales bacterium]|jgi:HlyD family secretion protein|nr:efflux RND transporter periplasmic adaptor subunit [Rhodocyclales bacterium]